jgi:hypothetical protein
VEYMLTYRDGSPVLVMTSGGNSYKVVVLLASSWYIFLIFTPTFCAYFLVSQ